MEILLDGATAVYGSDAIAGVVNFILKKNTTEGNAYAQYTWPPQGGANGVDAGISKGFGDLQKDGFNIMGTLGFSHQDKLMATDRSVSERGGFFPFTTVASTTSTTTARATPSPPISRSRRIRLQGGRIKPIPSTRTIG